MNPNRDARGGRLLDAVYSVFVGCVVETHHSISIPPGPIEVEPDRADPIDVDPDPLRIVR